MSRRDSHRDSGGMVKSSDRARRSSPPVRHGHGHGHSGGGGNHHGGGYAGDRDRDRDRDNRRSGGGGGGGGARSPLRSKLMAMAMSGSIGDDNSRRSGGQDSSRHGGGRSRDDDNFRRGGAKAASPPRRLRMDEHIPTEGKVRAGGGGGGGTGRSGVSHRLGEISTGRSSKGAGNSAGGGSRDDIKKKSELDRVVKRARETEQTSSFWNNKILEEEEKDPERWGHSGYKEMYRKDFQRSESTSPVRRLGQGQRRKAKGSRSRSRSFPSRSRSRSPKQLNRKKLATSRRSRSISPRHGGGVGHGHAAARRRSPVLGNSSLSKRQNDQRSLREGRHGHGHSGTGTGSSSKFKSSSDLAASSTKRSRPNHSHRHRDGASTNHPLYRGSSSESSGLSPSRKRSKVISSSRNKRSPTSPRTAAKKAAKRVQAGKKPVHDSDSLSSSSFSSSDEDEDVLQLHAKRRSKKKRGGVGGGHGSESASLTDSSSDDSSSSGASAELRIRRKRRLLRGGASSSSSLSSSSSDDDLSSDDSDVSIRKRSKAKTGLKKRASSVSSSSSMSSKASGTILHKEPPPPTNQPSRNSGEGKKHTEKLKSGGEKVNKVGEVSSKPPEKKSHSGDLKTKPGFKPIGGADNGKVSKTVQKPIGNSKTAGGPDSGTKNGLSTSSKAPAASSAEVKSKKAVKTTGKEEKKVASSAPTNNNPNDSHDSGETNSSSGTESSSDSDSEPKMTLSERFAKLTQMTQTDKREFAKPLLSMNEIDTKLKVVKDLRNAELKVFTDGQGQRHPAGVGGAPRGGNDIVGQDYNSDRPRSTSRPRLRPRSPDYGDSERDRGDRRYNSDERRRHLERMARDEPTDRPADWSDSRIRYQYYKDRGYFKDRPCAFEEFIKWEEWWYKYRDWLAQEGYYDQEGVNPQHQHHHAGGYEGQRQGPPDWHGGSGGHAHGHHHGHGHPPPPQHQVGHGGGMIRHGRLDGPGVPPPQGGVGAVPLSSRANFGRPEGNAYLQSGQHQNIRRRIGRTTNGSLVVRVGGGNGSGVGERSGGGGLTRGANGFRTGGRLGLPPNQYQQR